MKYPHEKGALNSVAKLVAKPLSILFANRITFRYLRLVEFYINILLGKGAGTGWGIDSELRAAESCIATENPVVFDIGSNKGEWAEGILNLFPEAELYLFEPQQHCLEILLQKKISYKKIIDAAVSSKSGEKINLHLNKEGSGIASLHPRRDSYFRFMKFSELEINTVTIDDVVRENGISRVDFMKMDIEGHEYEALLGAKKSLELNVIKALSFEFGSGNINSRTYFHDFWDLLTPFGYSIYRVLPSGRLEHINDYYEDCEYFRGVTNYIAVHRE